MDSKPLSEKFQDQLLQYSQTEDLEQRRQIEESIWSEYGCEYAVFVLDMSGFSLLTRKYGIVHYLSMIRRMQLTTEPIIKSYRGSMIKYEADNCFAVFPDPLAAVNAAIAMQHSFPASNLLTTDDLDIHIACGIDYGKVLMLEGEDCFGDPVNRACKIGEDIAAAGEILVTEEAWQMIPAQAGIRSTAITVSASGIVLPAYRIEYQNNQE
jgi:class 3 adenylate cyclase